MKRVISFALTLILLFSIPAFSLAEGTVLAKQEDRNIKPQNVNSDGSIPVNPVIEGESQTTGLPFTGAYIPMMAQISVPNGGVGEKSAPWGANYADIIYETPLHKSGHIRMSFIFADTLPNDAGPIRSVRVQHAEIREEWDAGLIYHGQQTYDGSNVNETFSATSARKKGVLFNGTDGSAKPWKAFFWRVTGLPAPDNVGIDVQSISKLIPEGYPFPNRPFLFTDELTYQGPDAATVNITQPSAVYSSTFVYDGTSNTYARFVGKENLPFVDSYTQEALTFSNVIVQRTKVTFKRNDAPYVTLIGSGNADIFIGGKYIAGYWVRTAMDQRTVFFDQDGNELQLQRGKTFISILDNAHNVSYK